MRRRQVLAALAVGVAGALAGCSDPRGSLRMDAVDDAELADRYARQADDLRDEHRQIVVDAVEDGQTTAEAARPPFEPDRPVGYGGRYYELASEVVDERDGTRYEFRIDFDPDGDGAETVRFADLSAADRAALEEVLSVADDDAGDDLGASVVYAPEEAEASVLVAERTVDVVRDGERYRVTVEDERPETLRTYRYTAEEVAASSADLADLVRGRFRFELTDLSAAERDVVDAARDGGYHEDEPTAAFRDVVERFRAAKAIEADEYGGEWLVRYDDQDYWARLETPTEWREATVADS